MDTGQYSRTILGEAMSTTITTFLMFEGKAEEAMSLYISLFENAEIVHVERYKANEGGIGGSIKLASFTLNGINYKCIDSPIHHGFTFTPAMSLYVNCDSAAEVERLFDKLSEGGQVLMPLDAYPFSDKFGWVADKFGVSWQLNLRK
jgi:predicted 3-demethylubiquinone-9 3-methyltransferase (glyoxalase superfamily)